MRPLFNVPGCGSFAFAMGITSGYPVGAKITASMREEKLLSKQNPKGFCLSPTTQAPSLLSAPLP